MSVAVGKHLLAIVEMGGYPNMMPLYQELGFRVELVNSQRKARSAIKSQVPDIVVAEYNYQSDFRDRSSNLETIMGMLRKHPHCKVIVFYMPDHVDKLAKFRTNFAVFAALPLPVTTAHLKEKLLKAI